MALQNTIKFKGITVNGGYIKVVSFSGDKADLRFTAAFKAEKELMLSTYKSNDRGELQPVDVMTEASALYYREFTIPHDLEGGNVLEQAYNHLKSLDEYSGALDV